MIATIAAIVAAVIVATTGGVVIAADGASPGDALYNLDLAVENARVNMAANPNRQAELEMQFAGERLEEAAELAEEGDTANMTLAFRNYGELVSSIAHLVNGPDAVVDREELQAMLDEGLAGHEETLATLLAALAEQQMVYENADANDNENLNANGNLNENQNENQNENGNENLNENSNDNINSNEADDADEAGGGYYCRTEGSEHPAAAALAEGFDVPYEDALGWFCEDGFGLGEISLALSAASADDAEYSAAEILELKAEFNGWGRVMQELGLIGQGRDNNPSNDDGDENENSNENLNSNDGIDPLLPIRPGNSDNAPGHLDDNDNERGNNGGGNTPPRGPGNNNGNGRTDPPGQSNRDDD